MISRIALVALLLVLPQCGGSQAALGGLELSDLPDCDADAPTFECANKLFVPLREADVPFDGDQVVDAMSLAGFRVASQWRLTALHQYVSEDESRTDCYFDSYQFAQDTTPLSVSGCGELILVGGHPSATMCEANAMEVFECTERVPLEEAFDIVGHRTADMGRAIEVATTDSVKVGDRVYLVGRPFFPNLTPGEQQTFNQTYPHVSYGRVVATMGRAIVTTNLAMFGNSGGPLVNDEGKVVGVLYARIGDVRGRGVSIDAALLDTHSVSVAIGADIAETIGRFVQ